MHILVVEDDKLTASTIQFALRREGFSCDLASRGADAISLATTNNYEIIILDLMLPDLDGYAVLRRLRAAKVYTPVLILSGLTELDNRVQGLRIGADDFLTKPFDIGELIARLRAVVRRSVSEPEATRRIGKLLLNPRQADCCCGGPTASPHAQRIRGFGSSEPFRGQAGLKAGIVGSPLPR